MKPITQSNDQISATITGPVSGQIAVGKENILIAAPAPASPPGEAELAGLRQALAELRQRVASEAPAEQQMDALGRVDELEEAITSPEPDLITMEYVRGWFSKHLPGLAETVTGIILNPIARKLVESAGEILAVEFRRRFGI